MRVLGTAPTGFLVTVAACLLAGWLLSGLLMVDTGQVALVFRFGDVVRTVGSGLGYRLPWPVEHDERVNVAEVQRVEFDTRRYLTGDINLVRMHLVVQYTVDDPVGYTLATEDPEAVITSEVLGVATAAAAGLAVDDLLTTGRNLLQERVRVAVQEALDAMGLGVRILAVDVRELAPPPEVVDAFNDVSSAQGDRETLALSAEAYASKLLPDARGRAARRVEGARGRASSALARARAGTARYRFLLDAWREDPQATRQEMLDIMMAETADHLRIIVAGESTEVVLPMSDRRNGP